MMSDRHRIVYVCEVCFSQSDAPGMHHGRAMIECDAGCPGDDCTRPVVDDRGRILTHAPRWWIFRHRREPHELSH